MAAGIFGLNMEVEGQIVAQSNPLSLSTTAAPSEEGAAPAGNDDWEFIIAPYFVAASISGDQSIGRIDGVDLDISPHDIFESLDFGAMLQAEVRKGRIGGVVNAAYMGLSGDESGPLGGELDWDLDQWTVQAYGTYRFPHEKGFIEPYLGVRYWSIDMEVDLGGGAVTASGSRSQEWVDVIGGLRLKQELNDRFSLLLQGDIGGFGATSDFTWYALAGVGYKINEHCSLVVAFSALGVDYEDGDKGTADYFEYDTVTYGPLMGLVFRF